MAGEKTEEQKRKEREAEGLPNPFPNRVDEVRITLSEEFFEEEAGTYIVDMSGENPADRVQLTNVVSGEGQSEGQHKPSQHYEGASISVPASPSVRASSWGNTSAPSSSVSVAQSDSSEQPPLPSVRASSLGFGMFRPGTAYGAAFKSGKLNEVNPVRDYAWSAIFALAGLSCVIAGGVHGNVPLIIGGVLLIALSSALAIRADQSNSNDKQDSNSGISYFPPTPVMF